MLRASVCGLQLVQWRRKKAAHALTSIHFTPCDFPQYTSDWALIMFVGSTLIMAAVWVGSFCLWLLTWAATSSAAAEPPNDHFLTLEAARDLIWSVWCFFFSNTHTQKYCFLRKYSSFLNLAILEKSSWCRALKWLNYLFYLNHCCLCLFTDTSHWSCCASTLTYRCISL